MKKSQNQETFLACTSNCQTGKGNGCFKYGGKTRISSKTDDEELEIGSAPQDLMTHFSGADPGFFLGGGALFSCSTSTPINHIVWQNTSCIRKPQVISGGGGGGGGPPAPPPPPRTPCILPLDPPLFLAPKTFL